MNLINALYGIPIPKHNKEPKARPFKLDNLVLAFNMIEQAQVKTNFLKTTHLIDKDLKMILGMLWSIILDYQIKGISVEELTAKEGLLLWCQKKTAGYSGVKVENFTTSWVSGLAFCALIHRHRPDLLDYDSLDKSDHRGNLQKAFEVAEKQLGIPRLLEPEDLLDAPRPDERAVMTYVSEYFLCFSSLDLKEKTAARIQKFIHFNISMEEQEKKYEHRVQELLDWIHKTIKRLDERELGETAEAAQETFQAHKKYLANEKVPKLTAKLDLEAEYAQIQSQLSVYERRPYVPPSGLSVDDLDKAWAALEEAEKLRGAAVRDNMFRFTTKATSSISPEQLKEFEASFAHFDKDGSGYLDRPELRAALSAVSVSFKNDEAFEKFYLKLADGNPKVSRQQYIDYLISLTEDKDHKEAINAAYSSLADGADTITVQQLKVHPLKGEEIDYMDARMPKAESRLDYLKYTDACFKN